MPIYEFYCPDCHAIYQFLAKRPCVDKIPACPQCKSKQLRREISRFAFIGNATEESPDADLPFDESTMMEAMESLAAEADSVSEDDPRAAADLMRKFASKTGMPLGDAMEEALSRMEAGEDPESVESDMGDLLQNDDALFGKHGTSLTKIRSRLREPLRDEQLYEMDS